MKHRRLTRAQRKTMPTDSDFFYQGDTRMNQNRSLKFADETTTSFGFDLQNIKIGTSAMNSMNITRTTFASMFSSENPKPNEVK